MFRSTLAFVYVFAAHPQPASVRLPGKDVKVELQFVHALAPVTFEYVPAEQLVHVLEEFAAVAPEYFPARQFVQTDALAAAYFPASHATHVPFTLTKPAWQLHRDVSSSKTRPDGHGSTSQAMSLCDNFLQYTRVSS
jgi:hypothetical protein